MSISKRQNEILELLRDNEYLTVKQLSEFTYTSQSSIRRDLTVLQNQMYIKRTHGGAKILLDGSREIAFNLRIKKNIIGKKTIAQKASFLLKDDMVIMLDSSSTCDFIIPHIAKLNNITLYTNNILTSLHSINLGIKTHLIGGALLNNTPITCGNEAYNILDNIFPDILFFSSACLDDFGNITDPSEEENYIRSKMINNAKLSVFLCDNEKFEQKSTYFLTNINKINYTVFDKEYKTLKTNAKII